MNMKTLGLVTFCTVVSSFAAQAQDVYVDGRNGNDNWDGSCDYAHRDETAKKGPLKTFETFRSKFNKVDGLVVYVAPATYYRPQPFTYWGATWLKATMIGTGTADDPVIFDGESVGCSLAVNQPYRSFRLENFVFRNGYCAGGGGAAVPANGVSLLSVSNCVFDTCVNPKGVNYHGGALALQKARPAEFYGCTFTNCSTVGNGGAIYFASATNDVKLVNCSFTDCVSSNGTGGAIYVSMADGELTQYGLVLENCAFTNNTAPTAGAFGAPVKCCANTVFAGNRATTGGAFYYNGYTGKHGDTWPMTNVFVSCTFTNNTASTGGAIGWDKVKRFVFKDCTFAGNVGTTKGAVWGTGETLYDFILENCRVERNRGESIFIANTARSSTSAWGVRIRNCVFADNDAGTSDLLYLTKTTDRIENCSFLRNIGKWVYEAGGATYNTNYLANCLFACNTNRCAGQAGIINIEWQGVPNTSCYNLTFVSNAAPVSPYVVFENHSYSPKYFANMVIYGNRSLNGETGAPLIAGFRNAARCCFFETGTENVPANRGNILRDDPKFIPGTFKPAPGSPIRKSGQAYDWMEDAKDLDGEPRLNDNGTVAMGCYRFTSPGLLLLFR